MNLIQDLQDRFGDNYEFKIIDLHEIKSLTKISIQCKIHNTYEEDMFINLLHKDKPCRRCLEDMEEPTILKGERKKRTLPELIKEFEQKHEDKFLYHDLPYSFKTMKDKVWIKCIKHDWFFQQTPNNHLITNICCPKCLEEFENS